MRNAAKPGRKEEFASGQLVVSRKVSFSGDLTIATESSAGPKWRCFFLFGMLSTQVVGTKLLQCQKRVRFIIAIKRRIMRNHIDRKCLTYQARFIMTLEETQRPAPAWSVACSLAASTVMLECMSLKN